MSRRDRVTLDSKREQFEKLIGLGVTVAKATWLSGINEPRVTKDELADRMAQWEADLPQGEPAEVKDQADLQAE